jgi:hypothetical protein
LTNGHIATNVTLSVPRSNSLENRFVAADLNGDAGPWHWRKIIFLMGYGHGMDKVPP